MMIKIAKNLIKITTIQDLKKAFFKQLDFTKY